jgi:ubiquinone/menaquinone biosynthesis C-methylase UbiE
MSAGKWLAKKAMKAWPVVPDEQDLSLWEVFNQRRYTGATPDEQKAIQLQSAQFRYDYEQTDNLFDHYFPQFDTTEFRGTSVLDLGSFTGGRLVYWVERYGFVNARGIDINPLFADAGAAFAASKHVDAKFDTGVAEFLPYADDTFDYVVTYDVLEHVGDVEKALRETRRVLKPGGKLLCVFPQFLQPLESHLGLVTGLPALQWIFPGSVLTEAYYEIMQERGGAAYWYARSTSTLEGWERLPTLNGVTIKKFRRFTDGQWRVCYRNTAPILSDGRRAKTPFFRLLRKLFVLPARTPILEELFLGRICYVLQKPTKGGA